MVKKLTEKKKNSLREFCNFICEQCLKHEREVGKLQVHRIKRGNDGGEYVLRNIRLLCKPCHKLYHSGEFRR